MRSGWRRRRHPTGMRCDGEGLEVGEGLGQRGGKPLSHVPLRAPRPRLLTRLRSELRPGRSHMRCFVSTHAEQEVARAINVPLHGNPEGLDWLGSKAGSRSVFQAAGVPCPDGFDEVFTRAGNPRPNPQTLTLTQTRPYSLSPE